MVLLEFSIAPLEQGTSVSDYVARAVRIVEQSGLDYRLHAMGTLVEGELDQVLDLLRRCFEDLSADCQRITCTAKFDYRRGYEGRLEAKVRSVVDKLGPQVKTLGGEKAE